MESKILSPARSPFRGGRAFTLVELMVVLAILGVLGTIGFNRMTRRNHYTATVGLAREIYALAGQARMAAIASRKQAWLRLQPQNPAATLRMALVSGNGWLGPGQWGPVEASVNSYQSTRVVGVDPGAMLNSAPPATPRPNAVDIIFYPDGRAQIAGNGTSGATIYIADANMIYRQRVLLYGRTGFAKVVDR